MTLAIKPKGLGEIRPSINNIVFNARVRLVLSPLVPTLPGFGGAMVTLLQPPTIKFVMGFGSMVPRLVANAVRSQVYAITNAILTDYYCWPQRMVVSE